MDAIEAPQLHTLVRWLKDGPPGLISIAQEGLSLGSLQAVTWEDAGDPLVIERLLAWQATAFSAFAVPLSRREGRRWLVEQVLDSPDRLLFWVRNLTGEVVGHVGLGSFDFATRQVGIRDVVRGESAAELLVTQAVATLRDWARESFQFDAIDPGMNRAAA